MGCKMTPDLEDGSTFGNSIRSNVFIALRFFPKVDRLINFLFVYSRCCDMLSSIDQQRSKQGLRIALENDIDYQNAYERIVAAYSYKRYIEVVFHLLCFDAFHRGRSTIRINKLSQNCSYEVCNNWYNNSTSNLPPEYCKVLRQINTEDTEPKPTINIKDKCECSNILKMTYSQSTW